MKSGNKICYTLGAVLLAAGILLFLNQYDMKTGMVNVTGDAKDKTAANTTVQEEIAGKILRLHVIANSDTEEDQALKLKVKDGIVAYLKEILKDANDLETAKEIAESRLQELENIAENIITQEGYAYSVTASLGEQEFPVKMYGDLTFPAGIYQALQIKIGGHQGKNWWCVLFPSLCFVDGTYSVVPEESKEELEEVIGEENYQTLLTTEEEDRKIEIRWKAAEWLLH